MGLGGTGWKGTWVGKGTWGLGDMVQKTYTFHGDMGFRGHGDMGFRGHGV